MKKRETPEQYEARRIRELEAEDPTVGQIFGRGPGQDPAFQARWAAVVERERERLYGARVR
jgi:hypothetical protein